jgi:hypothetical protein
MIDALLVLFKPAAAWERIFRAQRTFFYILLTYLLPVMVISCFLEGWGLHAWGKWQGEVPHPKKWPVNEVIVFETIQFFFTLLIIFVNSAVVKSVCETFQPRHSFLQAFTVIAYGLFPFFVARMFNGFGDLTPWISWLVGILLTIAVIYHGVPRVMQPDPAHAFGLYMTASLLLLLSTGLLELVVAFFLDGKLDKLQKFISSIAARLPF